MRALRMFFVVEKMYNMKLYTNLKDNIEDDGRYPKLHTLNAPH